MTDEIASGRDAMSEAVDYSQTILQELQMEVVGSCRTQDV